MYEDVETSLVYKLLASLGASTAGTAKDCWLAYLQGQLSSKGDLNDLEKAFVTSKGGSGQTLHDIWDSYLNSKSYTGSYTDKLHSFCNTASTF